MRKDVPVWTCRQLVDTNCGLAVRSQVVEEFPDSVSSKA